MIIQPPPERLVVAVDDEARAAENRPANAYSAKRGSREPAKLVRYVVL